MPAHSKRLSVFPVLHSRVVPCPRYATLFNPVQPGSTRFNPPAPRGVDLKPRAVSDHRAPPLLKMQAIPAQKTAPSQAANLQSRSHPYPVITALDSWERIRSVACRACVPHARPQTHRLLGAKATPSGTTSSPVTSRFRTVPVVQISEHGHKTREFSSCGAGKPKSRCNPANSTLDENTRDPHPSPVPVTLQSRDC